MGIQHEFGFLNGVRKTHNLARSHPSSSCFVLVGMEMLAYLIRPPHENSHELRTKFRLGGTYRGLYRVVGGSIKGYITNLVQGSHAAV